MHIHSPSLITEPSECHFLAPWDNLFASGEMTAITISSSCPCPAFFFFSLILNSKTAV